MQSFSIIEWNSLIAHLVLGLNADRLQAKLGVRVTHFNVMDVFKCSIITTRITTIIIIM